ncbi:MAG: hypothetical protein ABII01_07650 [Candidatus Woesearchaeota archaeon]
MLVQADLNEMIKELRKKVFILEYDIPHIYSKEMKARRIDELNQLKREIEALQKDLS